ncbi:thiamine/thiamine pyrophosphate ABC transporter permease ThiP [Pseudoprimorskyibacter insulae]|uniref:Sulfate transport system permease protein CysW n=1 Tax=Pseudoprimorskyibacter insulae TaxID=1695997 RepID=A0A2R8AV87_9RHOB|nr:thiamine/thiamine pyrophosphate ABC transporter permease ThiP [Pseudoprimorskyibacter insulae]SPF79814.1 Sulfate transport system permease protein CysW [Pseudoprimorskyibacter insulae]
MASRLVAISAAALVIGLIFGPIIAVLLLSGRLPGLTAADWQALRFTVSQAFLSALFSTLLAIPVARALARRQFPGRALLVTLLGAPFVLPTIVAALGLIAVFGQKGLVNALLAWAGLPSFSIYGFHGVVIAHVFFNLPLATRLFLQGWLSIPAEQYRLAATLNLGPRSVFRTLDLPMLTRIAPGAFAVIFVICLSSFAIALTLGGGPKATTVELAIYQALRFDFNVGHAATLALLQLGLAMGAGALALAVAAPRSLGTGLDRVVQRWDTSGLAPRLTDTAAILLAALFLLTPMTMVLWRGVFDLTSLDAGVWRAAWHSITIAAASTALSMTLALALANRWGEWLSLAAIAVSPLVLGIGLFLIVRPFVNPFSVALPVTAIVNAAVALPFALRILRPEAEAIRHDYDRLSASLGLTGLAWVRFVYLPRLRRPAGFAAGLTAALSMGDLGVIALFANPDRATLPLQIYRLMGAYRIEQAAAAALLLLVLSLGLFWVLDKGGRVNADL